MPKYKITDIDNTGVVQSTTLSNTVYMPGPSCYKKDGKVVALEPKLFKNTSALKSYNFESDSDAIYFDVNSLSYKLMVHLLDLGLYVLYEGVVENEDGSCPAIDWDRLQDKGMYDIRFLTMGGYFVSQAGEVICAQKRGDCTALLAHPSELEGTYKLIEEQPSDWASAWSTKYKGEVAIKKEEYIGLSTYTPFIANVYYTKVENSTYYELVVTKPSDWEEDYWIEAKYYSKENKFESYTSDSAPTFVTNSFYLPTSSQVTKVREYFESFKSGDTSYSSAFTPNFRTALESLGGSANNHVSIPMTFGYLFAYANSIKSNPEGYAIAGGTRGLIPELSELEYYYTNAESEMLQGRAISNEVDLDDEEDNVGCAINTAMYVRPFGDIIWGNRTFKNNDAILKTTATSFLNVRNFVNAIKKKLYDTARKYTFEQNSEVLWINFQSEITPMLEELKANNCILGYVFKKVATNAKARLKAKLTIVPIEGVEDFELEVELTNSISTSEE